MNTAANTDVTRYAAEGYCLFRDVLPESEIEVARVELGLDRR